MRFQCKTPNFLKGDVIPAIVIFGTLSVMLTGMGSTILHKYVFAHWSIWLIASFGTGVLWLALLLGVIAILGFGIHYISKLVAWIFKSWLFPDHDWKLVRTWFPWRVPETDAFGAPSECIFFEYVWKKRWRTWSSDTLGRVAYCQVDPRTIPERHPNDWL